MSKAAHPETRVNLERSIVLLIDDNPQALDILSSVVQGFGVRDQIKCASALEAIEVVKRRPADLILVDCGMPEMDGFDFVKWLRCEAAHPLCHTPVIILTGHASQSHVEKSRDCGASFVVAKPLTPSVLLQRIVWLSRDEREFVKCDSYTGPDRRVRNLGPPLNEAGRRQGDLSAHVGAAKEVNMDQDDIDMLMKPRRISL